MANLATSSENEETGARDLDETSHRNGDKTHTWGHNEVTKVICSVFNPVFLAVSLLKSPIASILESVTNERTNKNTYVLTCAMRN